MNFGAIRQMFDMYYWAKWRADAEHERVREDQRGRTEGLKFTGLLALLQGNQ